VRIQPIIYTKSIVVAEEGYRAMATKKKTRVKRIPAELPADYTWLEPTGEEMSEPVLKSIVLGIDPAARSGVCILDCSGPGPIRLVESRSIDVFTDPEADAVIQRAAALAASKVVPLVVVSEHSKNAYSSGSFGVNGFIGMIRAQGAWYRIVQAGLTRFVTDGGQFRVGRRTGIKPNKIVLIPANRWRDSVFGTTRFRDSEGKTHPLRREHWKEISVRAVRYLYPDVVVADDNEAEAILIAYWGARMAPR
jgi:hypothetical protein